MKNLIAIIMLFGLVNQTFAINSSVFGNRNSGLSAIPTVHQDDYSLLVIECEHGYEAIIIGIGVRTLEPLGYVDGMSLYGAYFASGFGLDTSGKESIEFEAEVIVIPRIVRNLNVAFGQGEYLIGESKSPLGGCTATNLGVKTVMKSFESTPRPDGIQYSVELDIQYKITAKGKNYTGADTYLTGALNISFGARSFLLYQDRMNHYHRFDLANFSTSIDITTCQDEQYCLCAEGEKDITVQMPPRPESKRVIRNGDDIEIPDGDDGFVTVPREIPEGVMTYGIKPNVKVMASIWRKDE